MNEFLPRSDPAASAVSATERVSAGVRAILPVQPATSRTDAAKGDEPNGQAAARTDYLDHSGEEQARAFATYSKVQNDIADVVESLGSAPPRESPAMLAQSENALLSLMPQPSVVVLLPPASQDMVAFVAQVTQSIARQAAQTRSAQANLSPAIVDAATA